MLRVKYLTINNVTDVTPFSDVYINPADYTSSKMRAGFSIISLI